jgi:hypothetical protein
MAASVARGPNDPVKPPRPGRHALIDPRKEDPLEFIELDLVDTFLFVEAAPAGTDDWVRAHYTIELLHLNDRDHLPTARARAYAAYRAFLMQYATEQAAGASATELRRIKHDLLGQPHPTVWEEMKRQHATIPELAAVFTQVPAALHW